MREPESVFMMSTSPSSGLSQVNTTLSFPFNSTFVMFIRLPERALSCILQNRNRGFWAGYSHQEPMAVQVHEIGSESVPLHGLAEFL